MAIQLYNAKFILLISASFTTIFSSIAIYFCLPLLISHLIRTQLALSPTSGSFEQWRQNSVIDRIYLYNITNLDELLSKDVRNLKPAERPLIKLAEVGPFTFRQDREKVNVEFNPLNETVLYDQRKSWTFLPELSIVKTIDELNSTWINHINVPLAGATLNSEFAELVEPMVNEFELKLFLNHSANTLLFEGYHDVLMESAKGAGQIDIDKFAWMYNQNNSLTRNMRVFTGPSNATMAKLGSIDQVDYQREWFTWHNNGSDPKDTSNVRCNQFRGSSAGEFFAAPQNSIISYNNQNTQATNSSDTIGDQLPSINRLLNVSGIAPVSFINSPYSSTDDTDELMRLSKTGKTISIFMPDICRVFQLVYNETFDYRGLIVDRYIANEQTYDYSDNLNKDTPNPNKCYCIYSDTSKLLTCPPNGMMDMYTCRKGSPTTLSFPHFHYSTKDKTIEPYLSLLDSSNMVTRHEDHEFFMDLESTLNIPVRVQIVLQFNIHFRTEPNLSFTKDYSFLMEKLKDSPMPVLPPVGAQPNRNEAIYDLYLPQIWIQSTVEVNDDNINQLKFIQRHLSYVTPIMTVIIFGLASILLMMSAKLAYDLTYGPKSKMSLSDDRESNSSLNQNEEAYLNSKQKYAMQLLDGQEKSLMVSSEKYSDLKHSSRVIIGPSTSKVEDHLMTSESQPLNG